MLTSKQVEEIRERKARGQSKSQVAREMGVAYNSVSTHWGGDEPVDPELQRLRLEHEKARLEKQIREMKAPLEAEKILAGLAKWNERLHGLETRLGDVEGKLGRTVAADTRSWWKCECGCKEYVAVHLRCTACLKENWWGWNPPK